MKWLKRTLLFLLFLPVMALVILYVRSEMIIRESHAAVPRTISLSTEPRVIAEGERLARVMGCFQGCHGAEMGGTVFFEEDWIGRFVAPSLTRAVRHYSPTELEAIIRQGVLPDGKSVLGMPSASFSIMSDEQLVAILSFIASYPEQVNDAGSTSIGPLARLGLVMGQYKPAAAEERGLPWTGDFAADPLEFGSYLATTVCSECHGLDLGGQADFTPPLLIAKAYSLEDFRKLMLTGVGIGDRDLGLMTRVASTRLQHMNDAEVEALHAYLQSR